MKNRPTNHSSNKSPNATREALNQEQAVSQALLRSFEATRSPWWTTVSAGVLAVSLGMAGVGQAGTAVTSGTATVTAIGAAPGVVTVAPKVVSISGTATQVVNPTVTVSSTANLEAGMYVYITSESIVRQITSITDATHFVLSGPAAPVTISANAMIPSTGAISADTVITQLLGSNYTDGKNGPVYPGEITNGATNAAHTITIGQGSYDGKITNGAGTSETGVVKDTVGILTLSGASTYSGGTELRAGQLRAGASTINGLQGQVVSGPIGRGTLTLVAGQLSGANGSSLNNLINVTDGATTVLTLGTESDSRDNSNANTSAGGIVPIRIENAASLNLNGNVVLSDSARLKVLSSVSLGGVVIDGAVGGAKSITKSGEGVLRMSSFSSYSGGTVLEAGELRAESSSYVKMLAGGGFGIADTSAKAAVFAAPTTLNLVQDSATPVNAGLLLNVSAATAATISVGSVVVGPNIQAGTTVQSVNLTTGVVTLDTPIRGAVTTFSVTNAVGPFGTGKITMKAGKLSGDQVTVANALDLGVANSSAVVSVALGRGRANQGQFNAGDNSTAPGVSVLTLSGATTIQQTANITVEDTALVRLTGQVSGKGFTKLGAGVLSLENYTTNVVPAPGVAGNTLNS